MTTEEHAATTLEMLVTLRKQHETMPKAYHGQELPLLMRAYCEALEPFADATIMKLLDSNDRQKQESGLEYAKVWLIAKKEAKVSAYDLVEYVTKIVAQAPQAVAETKVGQDICAMAVNVLFNDIRKYSSSEGYVNNARGAVNVLYWVEHNNIPLKNKTRLVQSACSELYRDCSMFLSYLGKDVPAGENLSNLLDPKAVRKVMKDKERVAEYRKEVSKHNSEKLQEYNRMYRRLQELDAQR